MFLFEQIGEYAGSNKLMIMPSDPPRVSQATAKVSALARGKVIQLDYTWEDNGPQEGSLMIGERDGADGVIAAWTDSFHFSKKIMICTGESDAGSVSVHGTYSTVEYGGPSSPDWGWRIVLSKAEQGSFVLQMFNILPDENGRADGPGNLAVDTHFYPAGTR